ncbi:MAG: molybdenum ABC transporter ATP-binding protein [Betaproteobacteria bacterium HGW-Betaproteobacteria-22]|nr:MAG: molybdenum ABC transporter ATP-binding protein [Betaproteobacteria bacterium HGW-Betaproteobacteria-22]
MELRFHHQRQSFTLDIEATLPDHGAVGVYGASGAGKSTMLAMMAGFIQPDSGRFNLGADCLFDSAHGINVPVHLRRIGMVFQDSRIFPHLTVQDNLHYGFKLLATKDRRFSLQQIVDLLEIGHLLAQKPHQLSGGEKQRVALGRALLASPRLLLLDEPLASLDVRLKRQILPFLRRIKDETQTPMVYVSHALDEILYLTSQIVMLDGGKVLAAGAFNQVIHDERVLALAQSLGLENVLHAKIAAHYPSQGYTVVMVDTQAVSIPPVDAAIGSEVSISVAASNLALSTHRAEGISIQNQLAGTVTSIQQVGSKVLVSVDVGAELIAEITAKALDDLKITQGCKVFCLFKTQGVYAFLST